MPRETPGVDRCAGDDDLEVWPAGKKLFEVAEQEVDGEATFVRFVDDDRVVLLELAIAVNLIEEDPVGHQLDAGVFADSVGEAHLVADEFAHLLAELFGDAFGYSASRNSPGLGVTDAGAPHFQQHLRNLGCLTRAGCPGDDDHLVVADGAHYVVPLLADGQLRRVRNDDLGFGHSLQSYDGPAGRIGGISSQRHHGVTLD